MSDNLNDWMQRYEKKLQKYPNKLESSPIFDTKDFFQMTGSVTFVPLWCPNFMQKLEKTIDVQYIC